MKSRSLFYQAAIALTFIFFVVSCSKTTSPSFPGVYYGTIGTSLGGNADTITITTGATSSSVIMVSKTSAGSLYTIDGTVSGSSLNIPSSSFLYNGATDTVSGSGSLNNSTLTISYHFTGIGGTNNYTFNGTKQ